MKAYEHYWPTVPLDIIASAFAIWLFATISLIGHWKFNFTTYWYISGPTVAFAMFSISGKKLVDAESISNKSLRRKAYRIGTLKHASILIWLSLFFTGIFTSPHNGNAQFIWVMAFALTHFALMLEVYIIDGKIVQLIKQDAIEQDLK